MSEKPFNPSCPKCHDQHPIVVKSADGKKVYARCWCGKSMASTDHPRASIHKAWYEELTLSSREKRLARKDREKTRKHRDAVG